MGKSFKKEKKEDKGNKKRYSKKDRQKIKKVNLEDECYSRLNK